MRALVFGFDSFSFFSLFFFAGVVRKTWHIRIFKVAFYSFAPFYTQKKNFLALFLLFLENRFFVILDVLCESAFTIVKINIFLFNFKRKNRRNKSDIIMLIFFWEFLKVFVQFLLIRKIDIFCVDIFEEIFDLGKMFATPQALWLHFFSFCRFLVGKFYAFKSSKACLRVKFLTIKLKIGCGTTVKQFFGGFFTNLILK